MKDMIPIKAILECVQKGQPITAPSQTKSTEVLLTDGNRYFLQNQFDLALQQYDKIINDMNYVYALNNKGKALEKRGRYQEAVYCYQMATNINPQTSLSWYNKGRVLHREGKFSEALDCYNEALSIDPNNANFWYDKSLTLTYMEKYQESIESCDKALKIDPNNARVWNSKGYALYKQGKLEDALNCSEKAVDVSPYDSFMSAWSLNTRGLILLEMNKESEALDSFDKSTQLTPNWFWSWYNKGRIYHKLGKLSKALDCYSKAYEYRKLYPSAHDLLKDSIISLVSEILTKDINKWNLNRKKLLVKLANEYDKKLATAVLNKL